MGRLSSPDTLTTDFFSFLPEEEKSSKMRRFLLMVLFVLSHMHVVVNCTALQKDVLRQADATRPRIVPMEGGSTFWLIKTTVNRAGAAKMRQDGWKTGLSQHS